MPVLIIQILCLTDTCRDYSNYDAHDFEHACMYTYKHKCNITCTCTYTYIYIYMYMYMYMYNIYIYIYIHIVHVHVDIGSMCTRDVHGMYTVYITLIIHMNIHVQIVTNLYHTHTPWLSCFDSCLISLPIVPCLRDPTVTGSFWRTCEVQADTCTWSSMTIL